MDLPRHPGAAVLVIDNGERLHSKCYGLADLETGRPIAADTSFYLASISKQFTVMAIMMLAEQGKLSFDDRLLSYFHPNRRYGAGHRYSGKRLKAAVAGGAIGQRLSATTRRATFGHGCDVGFGREKLELQLCSG